ncbi:MAG: MATE family efflux transporter, partial [Clostridia bacterium]|nr:MATE family efflux transporter [Clostridia bacterium]
EKEVKDLATAFIRIVALSMPIEAFLNAAYFTIRAGGKTVITFIFDSGYMWVVTVALAFALTRFTNLDIVAIYAICQFSNIVKAAVGYVLLRKNIWMNNIVAS